MKKIAILLALLMLLGCFAACGNEETNEETGTAAAAGEQKTNQNVEAEADICPESEDGKHQYEEELAAEATCTVPGLMMYTCIACNSSTTAEIPAVGHQGTGASCDEPSVCTVCGEVAEDAWGHVDDGSGICKNCGINMADVPVRTTFPAATEPETTEEVETTAATTQP